MSSARNALAANLKGWRKRRRLSVKALGGMTHVPESVIRDIEAGELFDGVPLGTVQALARALDVPVATLLAGELQTRRAETKIRRQRRPA